MKKVIDLTADVCRFLKKKNGADPFSIYMIDLIQKYGKLPHCPMKPVSFVNFYIFKVLEKMKRKNFRDTIISII